MIAKTLGPADGETLNILGHQRRLLLSSADTGGTYALIEQVSPPGSGVPAHYHEREEETFYVKAGRVEFLLDERAIVAVAGAAVMVPRRAVHAFTVTGSEPAAMLILLTPGGGERMFRELAALAGPPDMERVLAVCRGHGVIFV